MTLKCPFNCNFTTASDAEYLKHTKTHKPAVLPIEDKLWKMRLKIAQSYAGLTGDKTPLQYATIMWQKKPKDMDCGSLQFLLQDQGVTDGDNLAGLDAAVAMVT